MAAAIGTAAADAAAAPAAAAAAIVAAADAAAAAVSTSAVVVADVVECCFCKLEDDHIFEQVLLWRTTLRKKGVTNT